MRKNGISLYLTYGFDGDSARMKRLGNHKTGKACLYIKKLSDVNIEILQELISESYAKAAHAMS